MKKPILLAGTLIAAVLAAGASSAAGPGGFGHRGQNPVTFEELDADGNGEVTRAEMDANGQARFAAADTDGDGFLSAAELEARAQDGVRSRVGMLMDRADANKDGKLSMNEMKGAFPRRQATFEEMDTDKSGGLTRAELEAGSKGLWRKHNRMWNKG